MSKVNYFLTGEQQMIVDLTRQITEEKIIPVRAELDEKEEFPWDIMKDMARADLFGLYIPEEYGGLGGGTMDNCLAVEQLAMGCIAVTTTYAASALGGYPILLFGTDEQKEHYLPDIAAGKKLVAFGLTESNAGSDAAGIQCTAVEDGDSWVINGTKQWITSGGEAEVYTIIAMTDKHRGPEAQRPLLWKKVMMASPSTRRRRRWGSGPHPPESSYSMTAAYLRRGCWDEGARDL